MIRKKILLPIIACLLCMVMILPATADYGVSETPAVLENRSEELPAAGNDVSEEPISTAPDGNDRKFSVIQDDSGATIIQCPSSQVYTITFTPMVREVCPEEVLSGPTDALLEYFLESKFLAERTYAYMISSLSSGKVNEVDFMTNEVYKELITRDDLAPLLEAYAGELLRAREENAADEAAEKKFAKLMSQDGITELVKARITDTNSSVTRFMPVEETQTTANTVSATSAGSIYYEDAGTVKTASGADVTVYRPNREFTESEKSNCNNAYDYVGNTRLSSPSTFYNCHSFAWHSYSYSNSYWINTINEYLNDGVCSEINGIQNARAYDIIVYCRPVSGGYEILHSGVIESWNENVNSIKIRSKWGKAGVYSHSIVNVPEDYCYKDANGNMHVAYMIFRYHNYTDRENIGNYHSGKFHYFEYNKICCICQFRELEEPVTRYMCSGPPCKIPLLSCEDPTK